MILASFCLFPVYAQDSQNDNPTTISVKSLFPAKEGMRWRYLRTTREREVHYNLECNGSEIVGGKEYMIFRNPYGISYYDIDEGSVVTRGIAEVEEPGKPILYSGDGLIRLEKPIRIGNRWEGDFGLETEERIMATHFITEIEDIEKLEVPAGTFDAVLTSTTLSTVFIDNETGFGKVVLTLEHIWYAPDVGMIRRSNAFISPEIGIVPRRDDQLEEFKID